MIVYFFPMCFKIHELEWTYLISLCKHYFIFSCQCNNHTFWIINDLYVASILAQKKYHFKLYAVKEYLYWKLLLALGNECWQYVFCKIYFGNLFLPHFKFMSKFLVQLVVKCSANQSHIFSIKMEVYFPKVMCSLCSYFTLPPSFQTNAPSWA